MESLIGVILPPIIDLVNTKISNEKVKFVVSFLICSAMGVAVNYPKLKFVSLEEVLGSIALIFAGAQASYRLYWKTSNIRRIVNE